jgi:hypothetical protein
MIRLLQTRYVFVTILALGLFTMAARGMADPDAWWHLRTGQLILQNHAVFHSDPFSFTRFGQPWINHEWLSDVLLFGIYRVAGLGGLIVTFVAIIAVSFLLVYWRCPGRPYLAALMTLWGAVASASIWGVRPQMFSLLLASIFLLLLESSEHRLKLLWWTAPLMLLWANLHAGYPLGLVLIGVFLAGETLEAGISPEPWQNFLPRLKQLATAFVVCLAMVVANPYGGRIYLYPFETLHSAAMQRFIQEWFSPNFHDPASLPLLFMLLALIGVLAISPRGLRPRTVALLLLTIPAALSSMRHIPILMLVMVPAVADLIAARLQDSGVIQLFRKPLAAQSSRTLLFNLVVLVSFGVFAALRVQHVLSDQGEVEAHNFPTGAVAFIEREHPPEPIMNHYNWGGYFIWKLYPKYRVFMDGRADVYGDEFMTDFGACYYLTGNWRRPLERWNIRTLVLPPDAPLITALRSDSAWREIFADSQAVILSKQ